MNKEKCPQTKCFFNQIGVGCRKCEVCSCEEYVIDNDCDRCWNCKSDEGILRWDDSTEEIKEEQANKEELKPMEIKT